MSKIEDFGQHIPNAAKDRWTSYRDAMNSSRGVTDASLPMSQLWPEPPYSELLAQGSDPWTLAFIRSLRDDQEAKPRKAAKLAKWIKNITEMRDLCYQIIDLNITKADGEKILSQGPGALLALRLERTLPLYEALGHDLGSFKDFRLYDYQIKGESGITFETPKEGWIVSRPRPGSAGKYRETLVDEPTKEEAVAKLKDLLSAGLKMRRVGPELITYTRKSSGKDIIIGFKVGKNHIDIERHPTIEEAKVRVREHSDEIFAKIAAMKECPNERPEANRDRVGPEHRSGDISPEEYMGTFKFRGVQFGNYVENARRQKDLNDSYDGFSDLADVLGVYPFEMSLHETLSMAFGARGRGGVRPASAHFEPKLEVINMTKANGAGSLAHEWFHGFDRRLAACAGLEGYYLSETMNFKNDLTGHMRDLMRVIFEQTDIQSRSRHLDKMRTSPYWATPIEVMARSFECYVAHKLSQDGRQNDYLVNFVDENVWTAEAALMGRQDDSYPYLKAEETERVVAAFDNFFSAPEIEDLLAPVRQPSLAM
jgi:hypothetical protein